MSARVFDAIAHRSGVWVLETRLPAADLSLRRPAGRIGQQFRRVGNTLTIG